MKTKKANAPKPEQKLPKLNVSKSQKDIKPSKIAAKETKPVNDNKYTLLKLQKIDSGKKTKRGKKQPKIEEEEATFSEYFEEQNDLVEDMSQQMYSDKVNRVRASVRVRPFIGTEIGFDECISVPSPDKIMISDFTKTIEK